MDKYSYEEIEYIKNNYPLYAGSVEEFTQEYNSKFLKNRSVQCIVVKCSALGLKKDKIKPRVYTEEIKEFIKANIHKYRTIEEFCVFLNDKYNLNSNADSLVKLLSKIDCKKGHCKKPKQPSKFQLEHLCVRNGSTASRVKTENGYISSTTYFKQKYFNTDEGMLIHLNGDYYDFSRDNLVLVERSIYSSLQSRKWIFKDKEMTKTAILTCKLLSFFPEYTHNENAYLRIKTID